MKKHIKQLNKLISVEIRIMATISLIAIALSIWAFCFRSIPSPAPSQKQEEISPDNDVIALETDVIDINTYVIAPETNVIDTNTYVIAPEIGEIAPATDVIVPDTYVKSPELGEIAPATDVTDPNTDDAIQSQYLISIPGYSEITLEANKFEQDISFRNPGQNQCYFMINLYLSDGTLLWKSDYISPGESSSPLFLLQKLDKGVYENAVLEYLCFTIDEELSPQNQARTKLTLRFK